MTKNWPQTIIKNSTTVKKFTSLIENFYAKLPKLSKKKILAGSLLFLRGVSAYQSNSPEALCNNNLNLASGSVFAHETCNHQIIFPAGETVKSASSSDDISEFIVNNYKALDLNIDASEEEARKKYKKLSLKYHPDKAIHNGLSQAEATQKFQAIQNAYENLQKIFQLTYLIENEDELIAQIQSQIENSEHNLITANEHITSPDSSTTRKQIKSIKNDVVNTIKVSLNTAALYGTYKFGKNVLGWLDSSIIIEKEPDTEEEEIVETVAAPVQEESTEKEENVPFNPNPEDQQKKLDAELQAKAIATVNEHWNKISINGKINNQSKEQILNQGLTSPIDTWEKDIQNQTSQANQSFSQDNQTATTENQSSKNTFKKVGLPIIAGVSVIGIGALIIFKLTTKPIKKN